MLQCYVLTLKADLEPFILYRAMSWDTIHVRITHKCV